MQGRLASIVLVLTALAACKVSEARAPGSEPGGPGFIDASSLNLRTGPPPPLDPTDLEGIQGRGFELFYQEVGMHLAYQEGLSRVGTASVGALLPLASVDEGAHSGQVEFYRWRPEDMPDSGQLDPLRAHRWLIVPFLLRPTRVLENEQFSNLLDEKGEEFRKVRAVIFAADAAAKEYEGGNWHMHPFLEAQADGTRRVRSTRVYMFGLTANAPDLQVVVVDPRKKKEVATVSEVTVVHAPGDVAEGRVRTHLNSPGPLSVARAMSFGLAAGEVAVTGADGSRWSITAETGAIEAVGGASAEP